MVPVRQSFSWCACPCKDKGRGWGWQTFWLSVLPVLVSHPEVKRTQRHPFPPPRSHVVWLPSVSPWTDSFPSISWMVTSASSWWGTLGVWVSLAGAGDKVMWSWVPTLTVWEGIQDGRWDAPQGFLLFPSVALALHLPVHPGCSVAWISLSSALKETRLSDLPLSLAVSAPLFPFLFHFFSPPPPLLDSLSLCYSLGCAAWSSVGSSCGGEPHLCCSCAGWQCRPLCWRHLSVMTKIPTSSSDWSSGTWPHLPLKERRNEKTKNEDKAFILINKECCVQV